jgi:hypothetical protein
MLLVRRTLVAWLPVAILFTAPAALLLQRVPYRVEQPLIPAGTAGTTLSVLLPSKPISRGLQEAYAVLRFPAVGELIGHEQLQLVTATYAAPARLIEAHAAVEGTNCTFDTDTAQEIQNNGPLVLIRSKACQSLQGQPTPRVFLTILYRGEKGIALWTKLPAAVRPEGVAELTFPPIVYAGTTGMLEGALLDTGRFEHSRAELLAYVWFEDTATGWLWLTLALAAVLAGRGTAVLIAARKVPTPAQTFGLALALALTYAVLTPPLQAPDEPTHLLTFARVTAQSRLADEAARWSWRTHFERIRFHPEERFLSVHLGRPSFRSWTLVTTQDAARSAATSRLWWLAAVIAPDLRVANWLLVLRILNALVFAGVMAAVARAGGIGGFNPAFALLIVPTLPFFAMHLSNHAMLMCADVLIAGAAAIGFWRPERAGAAGVTLAAGQMLAIASGRIGIGAAPIVIMIAAGWFVFNSESSRRFARGAAAGVCILPLLAGPAYLLAAFKTIRAVAAQAGAWMLSAVPPVAIGRGRVSLVMVRRLALCGACLPPLLLLSSVFVTMPTLAPAQTTTLSRYVVQAVGVAATFPRLRGGDLLMSDTFWGGFGWLDTYPPEAFLTAMPALTALLLSGLLLRIARAGDRRQLGWLVFLAIGFCGSVVLLAIGSFLYAPDLHGRYLMAAYLPAVAIVWGALAVDKWATSLTFGIALVHACCLSTIVIRYF